MAGQIIIDNVAVAEDFINESERQATKSDDAGRVAKLEADGYLHAAFIRDRLAKAAFKSIDGSTTPVSVKLTDSGDVIETDSGVTGLDDFLGFVEDNYAPAITLPAFLNSTSGAFAAASATISVTANAGDNRILLVHLYHVAGETQPTAATWNSISLTLVDTNTSTDSVTTWIAIIGDSVSNETHDLVFTGGSTGGGNVRSIVVLTYDGTDQTTPNGGLDSVGSGSTPLSTASIPANQGYSKYVAGAYCLSPTTLDTAGMTSRFSALVGSTYSKVSDIDAIYGQDFTMSRTGGSSPLFLIGIALNSAETPPELNLLYKDVIGGFSGLTIGSMYYISATAGAISTTVTAVQVGQAISATEILIIRA